MKKLAGVLVVLGMLVAVCTYIVAQENPGDGVDVPEKKPVAGTGGLSGDANKALEEAIKSATSKLADLGKKKLSEQDLDSVLKETLEAIEALKKLLNETKDPAVREMINQLVRELTKVKEMVELTKREYSWGDVYGCPQYNKRNVDESLKKIDEILKKLGGTK